MLQVCASCLLEVFSLLSFYFFFFLIPKEIFIGSICTCSVGRSLFLALSVWKTVKKCDSRSVLSGEVWQSRLRAKSVSRGERCGVASCCSSLRQPVSVLSHSDGPLCFKKLWTNEWFRNSNKLLGTGVGSFTKAAQEWKVIWIRARIYGHIFKIVVKFTLSLETFPPNKS